MIEEVKPHGAETALAADPLACPANIAPGRHFSVDEQQGWWNRILDIYARMEDRARAGTYAVKVDGIEILVDPGVYAPGFFTDTAWYAERLPEIVGGRSLLEIGTGTGAIGLVCALSGCPVVATDINPLAVRNARKNARLLDVPMPVREGNLYEPVALGERFDFVFWAHPFNNCGIPVSDMLLRSGMDYRYESVRGYVSGAKAHLTAGGRLLIGTGDSADLEALAGFAHEAGYRLGELASEEMPFEAGSPQRIRYLIYEFVRV